ncbi:hypothetical protein ACI2KS_10765 [Pseudomonas sp. NPDC087358]|uniref:hypothetical protein n=1 Tax=Pseudomonas sp. NPDC087358 TaxID=3364439 RepID=UPI00384F4782
MARQVINLGETPSGTGGDTNRSANVKCNENFSELYEKMAQKGDNTDITSLSGLTTALSVEQGGTGASDSASARAALAMAQSGVNTDIIELQGLKVALSVSQGGTGSTNPIDACKAINALALGQANHSYGTELQNSGMPSISAIDGQPCSLTLHNGNNQYASAVMTFLRGGQFACHFGLDTDNQLKVGGWSFGNAAHRIYHEGNTTRAADGTLKAV